MGPDEGVLDDLLGVAVVVEHVEDDGEEPVVVVPHDLDERGFVAGGEPGDPGAVDGELALIGTAGIVG